MAEVKKPAPKAPKKEKVAKPIRLTKGWTEKSWLEHKATMTKEAIPEGWLPMSEIVKKAKEAGIKSSRICSAMGGDRAKNAPWAPVFQVVYVGSRKYGSPKILTEGFAKLNDPEFHKVVRKGRPKKVKLADKTPSIMDAFNKAGED